VNTLYALASIAISVAFIAIVYRFAGQIADIDDAMQRDLRDFPPTTPPPAAESIQEPSATSARR
jgi:hypothetical protein